MTLGPFQQQSLNAKTLLQVILPLFLGSVIAYLDRVNLAYAALTMNKDLALALAAATLRRIDFTNLGRKFLAKLSRVHLERSGNGAALLA